MISSHFAQHKERTAGRIYGAIADDVLQALLSMWFIIWLNEVDHAYSLIYCDGQFAAHGSSDLFKFIHDGKYKEN